MTDPTPRWRQIQRNHADAHAVLQRVAATIYEQVEEPVSILGSGLDLRLAIERGFLTDDDNKIAFSNPEIRRDYIVQHATSLALSAWDDLEAFARVIDEIQHRSTQLEIRREVGTGVLLALTYDHGKDVVGRIGEAAMWRSTEEERNRSFWSLYFPFYDALPDLDPEPESLADALEPVLQAVADDLSGGQIYGAVEKLAARSQSTAEALYETFVARPGSPVVALAANALLGLAKFDLPEAHHRALTLTDSEQPTLCRVVRCPRSLYQVLC